MHTIDGNDIELTQADTLKLKFSYSGTTLPSGTTLKFSIKNTAETTATAVVEKTVSVVSNIANVVIRPADTVDLDVKTYYWDARLTIPESGQLDIINTPMEYGTFTLLEAVARLPEEIDRTTLRTLIAECKAVTKLTSPNGTQYQIKVQNDGTLYTEAVN